MRGEGNVFRGESPLPPSCSPILQNRPQGARRLLQTLPGGTFCRMTDRSPKGNHMERKEVTRMLVGVQPQGQGTIRVVGAKLHGIVVTESKLNYHGSITIDTDNL